MKFSIVLAILLASQETNAIRLTCPDDDKSNDDHGVKTIQKAMDRFVAKHTEIEQRRSAVSRTDGKLKEVEKKEADAKSK